MPCATGMSRELHSVINHIIFGSTNQAQTIALGCIYCYNKAEYRNSSAVTDR